MTEEENGNGANGNAYVRYTTKELLAEIASKVDQLNDKFDTGLEDMQSKYEGLNVRVALLERDSQTKTSLKKFIVPVLLTALLILFAALQTYAMFHFGAMTHK